MSKVIFIALVVAALASAEAIYFLVRYLGERKGDELKRRLRVVGTPGSGPQILRRRRMADSEALADALESIGPFHALERLIEQTDMETTVSRIVGFSLGLAAGGALVGGVILENPAVALLLALIGGATPVLSVFNARAKRAAHLSDQLPDALEMMARSIKAGYALPSSFKLVAQECPAPVAVEFARAYEEQHFGLSFEQAVLNMTHRVPGNLDLKLFAVSVVVQKETGGNLVEVLENIAGTLRERFKFYSKLRSMTAEGKVSGFILGSMPWLVALMVYLTNPQYLSEFSIGNGPYLLATAIGMWCLGVLWIRGLMKVEY
jgi:tight adherence protein B